MINNSQFTNRIKKIMEDHQLTASNFADRIGVQRSSISHILSGRNKPSLDFVMKVCGTFHDVDFDWLLNGKGAYPRQADTTPADQLSAPSLFDTHQTTSQGKKIDRIVVFYDDGTFDEYHKH